VIFKEGVDPLGLSAPAWYGLHIADGVHKQLTGQEVTCTSTTEGTHSVLRSMHYTGAYGAGHGRAFDVRIWAFKDGPRLPEFVRRLKEELGDDYYVLLEKTHIHIHWGPVHR